MSRQLVQSVKRRRTAYRKRQRFGAAHQPTTPGRHRADRTYSQG